MTKRGRRHYQAAKQSDLTHGWAITPTSIDQILYTWLRPLRARSRDQIRNNDYAKRFIGLVKTHVVGPQGVIFQSHVKAGQNEPDHEAGEVVESAWKDWNKRGNCDYYGRLSLNDIERLFMATVAGDGEILIHKVRGNRAGDYGLKLQMLDPELLDIHYRDELRNGHTVRFGIELDRNQRRVAYYIRDKDGDRFSNGERYVRIRADRIIHEYIPEWVNQNRGIPWMASALLRMHHIGEYETSALVNAREGANKMGFYTKPEDDPVMGGDPAGHDLVQESVAGHWEELPPGMEIQNYDPTYPSGEFGEFTKAQLRGVASGLGVSYHTLANDLEGVNYSSARVGTLEDRDIWKSLQNWLIDVFCQPIFEEWLQTALVRGMLGRYGPADYERLAAVNWQPRRWQWVDPQKEIVAHEKSVALGVRSRSEIIREMGRDPEDVWLEIKHEQERMKALGIELPKPAEAGFLTPGEKDDDEKT